MGGVTKGKPLGPNERMFGGKGILVRFKPNLTDDSPEKSAHDPDSTELQKSDDSENPDDGDE